MTVESTLTPAAQKRTTERGRRAAAGTGEFLLLRVLPLLVLLTGWELFARYSGAVDIPGAFATIAALGELVQQPEFWVALAESNLALLIGYLAAVLIGVPSGLLMGRSATFDALSQGWLSIVLITPMAMVVPLIIMALGFGLAARSLVVFLFVLPMIVVNSRTGVATMKSNLVEMGRVYGCNEFQLWRQIIVPSAAPAIFTGLRVGIGRAVTGMVVAEWLLAAVGIGALLLQFRGSFQPALMFAVVIVVVLESLLIVQLLRVIENRTVAWSR